MALLADIDVRNLELKPAFPCVAFAANQIDRLNVSRVRGFFPGGGCAVVGCTACTNVTLDDVTLAQGLSQNVVRLTGSSGLIRGTWIEPGGVAITSMVSIDQLAGPTEVSNSHLPRVAAVGSVITGVSAAGCRTHALDIHDNTFEWPTTGSFAAVTAWGCQDTRVASNLIDGRDAGSSSGGIGIAVSGSTGLVEGNVLHLNGSAVKGVYADPMIGPLTVRNNRVRGSTGPLWGCLVAGRLGHRPGPGLHRRQRHRARWARAGRRASQPQGRRRRSQQLSLCPFGAPARGLVIWNRTVEVSSNHVTAYDGCTAQAHAISIRGTIALRGNTIEAASSTFFNSTTSAIDCNPPNLGITRVEAVGNLIGAGNGALHLAVSDTTPSQTCSDPARWRSNYFWTGDPSGSLQPGDAVAVLVTADAGIRDARNNLFNGTTACTRDGGYRLFPGSPCVDTGELLFTNDGGLIEFDLEGQSRLDAGPPDIGASELH